MFRLDRIFGRATSLLVALAILAPVIACADHPTIAVTLPSGRRIHADLIVGVRDDGLVVRAGSANAFVERQIPWGSISQAAILGQELSVTELKTFAQMVAPQTDATHTPETEDLPEPRFVVDRAVAKANAIRRHSAPAVAGVVGDAWLGQTNPAKPGEPLQVRISAVDHEGNTVPVDATAEIRFVTAAAGTYVRDSGAIGHSLVELGRWTKSLSPKTHPSGVGSWRLSIPRAGAGGIPYGMLSVRLVVPGSGVFETTVDGIRRRHFRPVQDALLGEGGVRTLP